MAVERDEDAGLSPTKVRKDYVVCSRGALKHLLTELIRVMTSCDKRGCKIPAMWRVSGKDKYSGSGFFCDWHVPGEGKQLPQSEGARIAVELLKRLRK